MRTCHDCSRAAEPDRSLCSRCRERRRRSRDRAACECGRPKGQATTCARCRYLDGRGPRERAVIEYLRLQGSATVEQVAEEMGITYNSAQVTLIRMRRKGRLGGWVDEDAPSHMARVTYYLIDIFEEEGAA